MEQINYTPWITGAAQPKLTQDRLMSIAIAVAPRHEQDRIMAAVAQETAALRKAIELVRAQLQIVREYRASLLASVITGRLDVREAAARLPEEPEFAETADEALADADDGGEAGDDGAGEIAAEREEEA
jgi:type I restriction enzyme S subunit